MSDKRSFRFEMGRSEVAPIYRTPPGASSLAAIAFVIAMSAPRRYRLTLTALLVIGLLANVFTSIYVSRAIFDWNLSRRDRQEALSI